MNGSVLFHLHIPKTGGSSLVRFLSRQYQDRFFHVPNKRVHDYWETSSSDLYDFWCISGHFEFGVHERIGIENFKYLTFVRDPIDRLLSLYHYFTYNAAVPRPELEKLGFERFVFGDFDDKKTEIELRHFVDNDMVRRVSGLRKSVPGNPYRLVNDDDFQVALQNLEYFAPIGLIKRYYDSVDRWVELFGWRIGNIEHILHQPNRLQKEDLPGSLIDRIEEKHRYDFRLYNHILKRDWQN